MNNLPSHSRRKLLRRKGAPRRGDRGREDDWIVPGAGVERFRERRGGGRGRDASKQRLCWYGPPAETSEIQSEGRAAERRRDEESQGADDAFPTAPRQPRRPAAEWRGPENLRGAVARAERDEGQDAAQFAPAQHCGGHEDGTVERRPSKQLF